MSFFTECLSDGCAARIRDQEARRLYSCRRQRPGSEPAGNIKVRRHERATACETRDLPSPGCKLDKRMSAFKLHRRNSVRKRLSAASIYEAVESCVKTKTRRNRSATRGTYSLNGKRSAGCSKSFSWSRNDTRRSLPGRPRISE